MMDEGLEEYVAERLAHHREWREQDFPDYTHRKGEQRGCMDCYALSLEGTVLMLRRSTELLEAARSTRRIDEAPAE